MTNIFFIFWQILKRTTINILPEQTSLSSSRFSTYFASCIWRYRWYSFFSSGIWFTTWTLPDHKACEEDTFTRGGSYSIPDWGNEQRDPLASIMRSLGVYKISFYGGTNNKNSGTFITHAFNLLKKISILNFLGKLANGSSIFALEIMKTLLSSYKVYLPKKKTLLISSPFQFYKFSKINLLDKVFVL